MPKFFDYLYTSFTNSTSFGPTDTMPLTTRAKALMMVQSASALVTVVLVASRAHWDLVNGMSNRFQGWGGEDDELFVRWRRANLTDGPLRPHRSPHGRFSKNSEGHFRQPFDNEKFQSNLRALEQSKNSTAHSDDGYRQSDFKVVNSTSRSAQGCTVLRYWVARLSSSSMSSSSSGPTEP